MDDVTRYNQAIQSGEVVTSKKVATVYARLAADVASPIGRWVFDERRAARAVDFIERFCKHSKGEWAGRPVKLMLWQRAFVAALFGFVDRETGERRFKEALLFVARKNGKSTLAAGIALYLLIADGEPGSEVYTVATKKDQARIIFDETCNMVEQSALVARKVRKRRTDLYVPSTRSKMEPLGKNSDTMDGLNAHGVIIDELHSIRDRNLYEVMKQSQSTRRQPVLLMVTTAGTVRECIADDMYDYAEKVINGTIEDERFLAVVYELDERKEYLQPEMWVKANPGIDEIKKRNDLEEKVARAKNNPIDLAGILVKDFDIRDNANGAWLSFEDIYNPATFDIEDMRGAWAIGGADLSITTDLTCATLLMYDRDNDRYNVAQMYWIPEDNLERRVTEDKIPYDRWHEMGLIRLCRGNSIVYSDVTAWFVEMLNEYDITPGWIYYDAYSAKYWVEEMESLGFRMVKTFQGVKTLSLPMQRLGADLQKKKVVYNNSPILKWCLSNTTVKPDINGNIQPMKNQKPTRRIDGTASLVDAYVGLNDHYNEFVELA